MNIQQRISYEFIIIITKNFKFLKFDLIIFLINKKKWKLQNNIF